ncbi:hypothetical protein HDA40_006918 [Hamadaea flava]|uniref:CU044_5270 family protein n=1 Tax=Hamadaea flava TaxID=1742688 RepID=A0ABV8M2V0_9ACTN|nr:CU044_5270 family protein [Hamadaea flava]MCP2328411.1 hypothetical protein [Hamadaea flava]
MNELTILDDLGATLDPAGPPPPGLRRRVLTQTRRPSRRRWLRLAIVGGLAATVTAVALAIQVVPLGDRPPAARAQAADILLAAAGQATLQPDQVVRPEQFILIESVATVRSTRESTGESTVHGVHRWAWRSADGTHDGLIREQNQDGGATDLLVPGCKDGRATQSKRGVTTTSPCTPDPAYTDGLPTTVDGMLAYLYRDAGSTKNPRDQEAFQAAANLIGEAYRRPAVLAAVYGALAKIPGVAIVGDVTDEAGRSGVAISQREVQGTRTDLIFDPANHSYLGIRTVAGDQVQYSAAVLSVSIVDRVGAK